MTSRRQLAERPAPRLYLVTQRLEDAGELARTLEAALSAGAIAAVLLRPPYGMDERSLTKFVKQVAPVVQAAGAALLLEGHPDIVARAGADGAHLTGIEALTDAIAGLQPQRIAGVGGLFTRHDAMLAGEAGVDYVAFGEADAGKRRPGFDAVLERVEWWSEVFEIPCVGFAETPDEVKALAAAGADFVAICDIVWSNPRGPAAAVASAAQGLGAVESV